jgi:hypothetical protein
MQFINPLASLIFYTAAPTRANAVVLPVTAAVGGKVVDQTLHRINLEYNRLKRFERSGGFGSDNTVFAEAWAASPTPRSSVKPNPSVFRTPHCLSES